MMNVEDLRSYCLSLDADVVEKFPFTAFKYAKDVLVFYIAGCYFDINDLSNVTVYLAKVHIFIEKKAQNHCSARNLSKFYLKSYLYNTKSCDN